MKKVTLPQYIIVFFSCCVVALLLTFIGLRLYYTDSKLQQKLTKHYTADSFQILAGKAVKNKEGNLLVNDIKPENFSFVNIGNIHLNSQFYDSIVINFAEKHFTQPITLTAKHRDSNIPVEKQISYTNQMSSKFPMDILFDENVVLTDIGLLTQKLITPYSIASIKVVAKSFDNKLFAELLINSFAINKKWENWSINTHKPPYPTFITPKLLLLIYFSVVGGLFTIFLWLKKRPLINAWWASIIIAWLALDMHYLVEKTVITKNTYEKFAHLSDAGKYLVLSPEPAKIAQMIQSVLPKDGEPKKIRIQFGWKEKWLTYKNSDKRYINGKIQYYLYPHTVYTLGDKISKESWQQGGFYYVEAREKKQRLAYDDRVRKLSTEMKQQIIVKRLLDNNNMSIYFVEGNKKPNKEGEKK